MKIWYSYVPPAYEGNKAVVVSIMNRCPSMFLGAVPQIRTPLTVVFRNGFIEQHDAVKVSSVNWEACRSG